MPKKASVDSKPGSGSPEADPKPNKSSKPAKPKVAAAEGADAIALLEADHREVRELFKKFAEAEGDASKRDLAVAICVALKVHTRLEEEIFYPAAYAAIGEGRLVEEAIVEHASAKDLIAQIESGAPGEALFDARVTVLCEYVEHHVAEEEDELFPLCRKSGLDLDALGDLLAFRKQELMTGFVVSNPVLALS